MDVFCAFLLENLEKFRTRCSWSRLHVACLNSRKEFQIVKGVSGLPDSLRGWWKELRDTLQGDSSGHLIRHNSALKRHNPAPGTQNSDLKLHNLAHEVVLLLGSCDFSQKTRLPEYLSESVETLCFLSSKLQ